MLLEMCLFTEVFYCSLGSPMQSQCEIHYIELKGRQIQFTSPAYCSHNNHLTELSTLKHTNLRQLGLNTKSLMLKVLITKWAAKVTASGVTAQSSFSVPELQIKLTLYSLLFWRLREGEWSLRKEYVKQKVLFTESYKVCCLLIL